MSADSGQVECHPWEPDEKGGGFPCISVYAEELYEVKDVYALIKKLLSKCEWLEKQNRKMRGEHERE